MCTELQIESVQYKTYNRKREFGFSKDKIVSDNKKQKYYDAYIHTHRFVFKFCSSGKLRSDPFTFVPEELMT